MTRSRLALYIAHWLMSTAAGSMSFLLIFLTAKDFSGGATADGVAETFLAVVCMESAIRHAFLCVAMEGDQP